MSVAWGLPRDRALRALTIDAAEILGVDDVVGSLEPASWPTSSSPMATRSRSARRSRTSSSAAGTWASRTDRRTCPRSTCTEVVVPNCRILNAEYRIEEAKSHLADKISRSPDRRRAGGGATLAPRADAPNVYAIGGARIVTSAGAPIASGTVVIRDGRIEAVGADVAAPPTPGSSTAPASPSTRASSTWAPPPGSTCRDRAARHPQTTEEVERWKRRSPATGLKTADHVKTDAADLHAFAAAGVTTVLAGPRAPASWAERPRERRAAAGPAAGRQRGDVRSGLLVVRPRGAARLARAAEAAAGTRCRSWGSSPSSGRRSSTAALPAGPRRRRAPPVCPRPPYDPALEALRRRSGDSCRSCSTPASSARSRALAGGRVPARPDRHRRIEAALLGADSKRAALG